LPILPVKAASARLESGTSIRSKAGDNDVRLLGCTAGRRSRGSPMIYAQYLLNGLLLGGLYACIAAGFSLVWGVMNIINIMHGALIVLGAYIAFFSYSLLGVHPFFSMISAGLITGLGGYLIQRGIINRVVGQPVLVTFTLTFGLDMILNNAMLLAFTADYRKVVLTDPLGTMKLAGLFVPLDRLVAMLLALAMIAAVY